MPAAVLGSQGGVDAHLRTPAALHLRRALRTGFQVWDRCPYLCLWGHLRLRAPVTPRCLTATLCPHRGSQEAGTPSSTPAGSSARETRLGRAARCRHEGALRPRSVRGVWVERPDSWCPSAQTPRVGEGAPPPSPARPQCTVLERPNLGGEDAACVSTPNHPPPPRLGSSGGAQNSRAGRGRGCYSGPDARGSSVPGEARGSARVPETAPRVSLLGPVGPFTNAAHFPACRLGGGARLLHPDTPPGPPPLHGVAMETGAGPLAPAPTAPPSPRGPARRTPGPPPTPTNDRAGGGRKRLGLGRAWPGMKGAWGVPRGRIITAPS